MYNRENCNAFICSGDYNTNFERLNAQTECLNNFIVRNNLCVSWNHTLAKKDFTYTNFSLNHFSCIDHIILTENLFDTIEQNYVLCEPCNPSSHNIVYLCIGSAKLECVNKVEDNLVLSPKCNWSKATNKHIQQYQCMLNNKLSTIDLSSSVFVCNDWHCTNDKHREHIDILCKCIIDCCISAGFQSIPMVRSGGNDVPGWYAQVAPEREQSLLWHWIWLESGKPQRGIVYDIMKKTRHRYHYAVRCCKRQKFEIQKQKLTENMSRTKVFWTETKKINPTNKVISNTIGNANGYEEISKLFFEKYSLLYNSVPTSEEELSNIRKIMDNTIVPCEQVYVTPDIIKTCIGKLKSGKDDGDHGLKSDHIINGTPRLNVLLSLLFNIMQVHGHTAQELLKSTIISIPKDNKASLSSPDNYRGISLFSCICKVYDNVILYMYGDKLISSDMQFGYKKDHSTVLCTLISKEVISHYLNGNSNIYSCLLDASKAFDRVHFGRLFRLLLAKPIPKCVIRLIFDSYIRQTACATWNGYKSDFFTMANGVKQGAVLSSIFFSLYIDPLLTELSKSGYGCHIKNVYMGALAYADDITLICPSISGLNEMLKICYNFGLKNNLVFNCNKTVCIKFGEKVRDGEYAIFNDSVLSWKESVRHLGNFIDTTMTDQIDCITKKSMFIGYVNKLRANYSKLHPRALINLFKSYCCSFYGSHLWYFNSNSFDKCCKSWNVAVRMLLQLPYNTHTWILGALLKQNNIKNQLYIRNFQFLLKAHKSDNIIVKTCIDNARYNANTCIGYKFAFYRYIYNLDMLNSRKFAIRSMGTPKLNIGQIDIISNLSELLAARSGEIYLDVLNINQINDLINTLCTE